MVQAKKKGPCRASARVFPYIIFWVCLKYLSAVSRRGANSTPSLCLSGRPLVVVKEFRRLSVLSDAGHLHVLIGIHIARA